MDEPRSKPAGGSRAPDLFAAAMDRLAAMPNVRFTRRSGWGLKITSGRTHLASVADRDVEAAPQQTGVSALKVAQEVAAYAARTSGLPEARVEARPQPSEVWAVFANGRDVPVVMLRPGVDGRERRGYADGRWLDAPPRGARAAGSADS